jgi:hypothetical protein
MQLFGVAGGAASLRARLACMGIIIPLEDARRVHDMIRQEPVLAALRYPRPRPEDRQGRIVQFRQKAEELRTISDDIILSETRSTLLSLAQSYEHMAHTLEDLPQVSGAELST